MAKMCYEDRGDAIYSFPCEENTQGGFQWENVGNISNQFFSGIGSLLSGIGDLKGTKAGSTYVNNAAAPQGRTGDNNSSGSSALLIGGGIFLLVIIILVVVLLLMKSKKP